MSASSAVHRQTAARPELQQRARAVRALPARSAATAPDPSMPRCSNELDLCVQCTETSTAQAARSPCVVAEAAASAAAAMPTATPMRASRAATWPASAARSARAMLRAHRRRRARGPRPEVAGRHGRGSHPVLPQITLGAFSLNPSRGWSSTTGEGTGSQPTGSTSLPRCVIAQLDKFMQSLFSREATSLSLAAGKPPTLLIDGTLHAADGPASHSGAGATPGGRDHAHGAAVRAARGRPGSVPP
jgi:hypothetical protein